MITRIDVLTAIIIALYLCIFYIIIVRPQFLGTTMRFFLKRTIIRVSLTIMFSYIFILYYLYSYQYGVIKNYDGLLQIIGEIIGVVAGIFLAFYYDRIHEQIAYVKELEKILSAINRELENNIGIINDSFEGRANYGLYWQILQTTTWDIYKERLNKAPTRLLNILLELYYYIYLLNISQIPKGIRTNDFNKLKVIANTIENIYSDWVKESKGELQSLFFEMYH